MAIVLFTDNHKGGYIYPLEATSDIIKPCVFSEHFDQAPYFSAVQLISEENGKHIEKLFIDDESFDSFESAAEKSKIYLDW